MYDTFAGFEWLAEFQPLDGHSFVDVIQYGAGDRQPYFRSDTLKHGEVSEWLKRKLDSTGNDNTGGGAAKLRVLLCSPRQESAGSGIFFPFSRDLYAEIASCFHLPAAVIGYASAEGMTLTKFEAFQGGYGILAVLKKKTLVVSYDPATATTYVLELGLCTHEIDSFVEELKHFQAATPLVTSMITSWISVNTQLRARSFVDKKLAVLNTEAELGLHLSSDVTIHRDLRNVNFQGLTRQLMILNNAWDDTAIAFQLKLISQVLDGRGCFGNDAMNVDQQTSPSLRLRLMQIRDLLDGLHSGNKEIQQRASVLLQTIYNLISQRDNEISYATAVASQRIAEASHRDSIAMKQLAADSKDIAIRTYLDSANMKTMTLINLCTLPGTFTATFFSTGFFNFKPKDSSSVVSKWIWLYCVITSGLTCLLFLSWHIGYRRISRPLETSRPRPLLPDSTEDHATLETKTALGLPPQKYVTSEDAIRSQAPREPVVAQVSDRSPFQANELEPKDIGAVREKLRTWFPMRTLVLPNTCSICARPFIREHTDKLSDERDD